MVLADLDVQKTIPEIINHFEKTVSKSVRQVPVTSTKSRSQQLATVYARFYTLVVTSTHKKLINAGIEAEINSSDVFLLL